MDDEEPLKYQDLILDAIDQLRRRKARPDAERIYNCLFRRKGVGSAESKIALEKCVEAGVVLRVSYKGNISYRNAAKKYARQRRLAEMYPAGCFDDRKPKRKFTNLLTNAFADLVLQEPDYLDLGIPPLNLIKTILAKDSVRYTRKYLWILLQKEVDAGGLVQLENGNFLVGKPPSVAAKNQVRDQVLLEAKQRRLVEWQAKKEREKEKEKERELRIQRENEEKAVAEEKRLLKLKRSINSATVGNGRDTNTSNAATVIDITDMSDSATGETGTEEHSTNTATTAGGKRGRPKRLENMKKSDVRRDLRVGGRRKKAKKVFDPSESNMPKRRGRPLGSTKNASKYWKSKTSNGTDSRPESSASQNGRSSSGAPNPVEGGVCSVCHVQNKKGPAEKLVSCRECSNKAHAHCLNNGDDMMLKLYPDNTWTCPHCKTCVICFETSDAGNLVVCSICADAYHNACHSPRISDKIKPSHKWQCNNCQMPEQLAVDNIQIGFNMDTQRNQNNDETTSHSLDLSRNSSPHFSSPSSPTLPTLSPQMTHNGLHHSSSESDSKSDIVSLKDDDLEENIDPSIPDASNWTSDEVAQYFSQYFPDEAAVFREQEIDGHSLLLMKRMDVLKGLCLKLGPALKIYRHVLKLQYRRDDPKLYWV